MEGKINGYFKCMDFSKQSEETEPANSTLENIKRKIYVFVYIKQGQINIDSQTGIKYLLTIFGYKHINQNDIGKLWQQHMSE